MWYNRKKVKIIHPKFNLINLLTYKYMGNFRRFAPIFMPIAVVGIIMGVFLFIQTSNATVVSGVALTDADTTGYGLDGRDFSVTWTPTSTPPSGYQSTQIYITTSGVQLTIDNINTSTACGGSVPEPRGFFNQFSGMATFTLPNFPNTDSCRTAYATSSSYVAWVYTVATASSISSSSAVSYAFGFDTPTDTAAAQIDHIAVHTANVNATATLYATIFDDQTNGEAFGNTGDGGAEFFKAYYGANVGSSQTAVDAVAVSGAGELYSFTIPASALSGATLQYYLIAQDRAGNKKFICASGTAVATSTCQSSPFVINTVSAGSRSVSGQVANNGTGLASAKVFAAGFGGVATTTDGSGNYILTGLPDNDGFDFTALKMGYGKATRMETIGSSDKTGVNLNLNFGSFGFFDGGGSGGAGGGSPRVVFSGPPDGMQGFNISESLRVGFNQPMDATSITTVSSVTSSNVYLIKTATGENVAGSVTYCANNQAAGCSGLFSMDTNVVLFDSTADLATSTQYTLVITEKVKSQGGQAVEGNRTGGGHRITFATIGNQFNFSQISGSFGMSGAFMPPYVRSAVPAPGMTAAPNIPVLVEFNDPMQSASINTSNIQLWLVGGAQITSGVSVSLDSNEQRFATISHNALSAGNYEVRVLGAATNLSGLPMRSPTSSVAFSSQFTVGGSADATSPTIYPALAANSTGVATNKIFEFGFNEQLSYSTVNTSNITVLRGATAVSVSLDYDPGKNSVFVAPGSALTPNTVYTITFSPSVTDLAGNAVATTTYTYTTGAADSTAPQLREARCDDYRCEMTFNEPMISDSQSDSRWAASILNSSNWTITVGGSVVSLSGKPLSYDPMRNAVSITGLGLTVGATVTTTVATAVTDLSDNVVSTSLRTVVGKVEDSKNTFGSFGDMGMFGPPTGAMMGASMGTTTAIGSGEFKPQGFGSFTASQFAFGQADMAFPMNPMANADSNVFQVKFVPNVVLATGDQVVLTFPNGTTITNAALDTYSPFYTDFNQFMAGTITGSGVAVDSSNNKVTITLGVSGTPNASDPVSIDLKKIINPSIPKDPSSGGYTVGIKVLRAGIAIATKTSMPYFIMPGGSNTLTVNVATADVTTDDGTVNLFGGGPGGPMNKVLTITNGAISAVDGTSTTSVIFSSLPNGCYNLGTDPYVTLGSNDYYGQMSPDPICLTGSGGTKNISLTTANSGGGATATLTVKWTGVNFGGKDLDIFAGGPGKFISKTITGATIAGDGYQVKLNANGNWFVGMGPAMSKSASGGKPANLGVMPPPPVNLSVSGIGSTPVIVLGNSAPPGVSYSNGVVTFAFAASDKTVTGTVKDVAGNALANVDVFIHRQGFGQPIFTQTNASGTFSLAVADLGGYEIGAHKDGMPDIMKNIELRTGNAVYINGQNVTGNFVLTMKKSDYTISGKVLDGSNQAIGYAPVTGVSASGASVFGMTASDGSYTLFVDNGTWNLRAELPSNKTDSCGSFTKTVTVSGSSQSSQNITPSVSTCYTLSGSVVVGEIGMANVPVFIEEWDNTNDRPVVGGNRKGTTSNSNGLYSVSLASGNYRVGVLHPDYGELSATTTIIGDDTVHLSVSGGKAVRFTFTGGTADMQAFIELKNATNNNKKITKQVKGLGTTQRLTADTANYTYSIDIFGVGKFSGTISSASFTDEDSTAAYVTVDLGLGSANFITVTGTVYDNSSATKSGALVTFTNASSTITAVTDSNGQYSMQLKAGTYAVSDSLSGYLGAKDTSEIFNASTTGYDFGGATPDQAALQTGSYTISGTVSSSAGTAMSTGYVWATNASGTVASAPINADGTYSLAVATGTWTLKGTGANHAKTTKSGGAITVSGGNQTANFALTADVGNAATSTSGIVNASSGGSVNDMAATGMKLTAAGGVLDSGQGDVTLNFEKSYNAPDSGNSQALGNASFNISATGDSSIKTFIGNAELTIDYSSLLADLPAGISESDLKLAYYSPERGEYVPVEGGFTVDIANNTITGLTEHLTDFVITYTQGDAGITVTESDEATAITEGGTTDTVSYVLTSQPTADVVITPSIASQATRSPSSLTFTSVNYATPQSITITAADDSTVEGSHSATITHVVTSDDTDYNGLAISNITVTITDNDSAGGGGGGGSSDSTPPTNTSVVIAVGATSTATTSVNLTLAATGASHMMVANDSAFAGGVWTTYSTTKAWVLAVGDGVKTVYAKFRDDSGNVSNAVSDTITLISPVTTTPPPVVVSTTTQPVAVVVTPAITIIRCKGNLNPGARGNAVKDLQAHLKELGYFTYPTNTGYYGPVTAKAVSAYQKFKGLPVTGKLNTATCDKLNGAVPAVETSVTPVVSSGYKFTKYLGMGATGEEVKQLQQVLKDLGYFTYPTITGYYGAVTKAAVVKFQKAKDLKPFPGWIGPGTRAALNSR